MLKVYYFGYDDEYNEDSEEIVLGDNFDVPDINPLHPYLADFIKYWKFYKTVNVIFTQQLTQEQFEKDEWDMPTDKQILRSLSMMKKYGGLTKYGIDENKCPLCERQMPDKEKSKHHLIPCAEGGTHGKKAVIHRICHVKIHSLFTEEELAKNYNTIDKLKEHTDIIKFIKWVSKKDGSFYDVSRRSKHKYDKKYSNDLT